MLLDVLRRVVVEDEDLDLVRRVLEERRHSTLRRRSASL